MDEIGKVREVEIAGVLTLITLPVESACEVIDEKRREEKQLIQYSLLSLGSKIKHLTFKHWGRLSCRGYNGGRRA